MARHLEVENSSETTLLAVLLIFVVIVLVWSVVSWTSSKSNEAQHQIAELQSPQNSAQGTSQINQQEIQKTPQQQCEERGNNWCNGQCYTPCSDNQRFNCPSNGVLRCINTKNVEDVKKSIVWVKYEVTGKNEDGSYFENGGSGSGVIFSNKDSKLSIYTNRHVVDCSFNDMKCYSRLTEKTSVRTQDGQTYHVSKISFAPHNLDIAILEVDTANAENYQSVTVNDDLNIGDSVTAIGYPSYAERVVEFSIAKGKITALKDLLMNDGFAFNSIESDVYTYFGSSGGGLFDKDGNLVGINTWGTSSQKSIAIKISSLRDIDSFVYCKGNTYLTQNGYCVNYCGRTEILGKDNRCYGACDAFYCESQTMVGNDPRCQTSGYILGSDGYCHQPCGSLNTYCGDATSICYKNRCISGCPLGTYLFRDGTCRIYA